MEPKEPQKRNRKLHIPSSVPHSDWCDFRIDYESGMTLQQIGEKYCCDPRTVRTCIIKNRSSQDLGRKSTPSILKPFHQEIARIIREQSDSETSIYSLSCLVTKKLRNSGYAGSERTVRNYLSDHMKQADKEGDFFNVND